MKPVRGFWFVAIGLLIVTYPMNLKILLFFRVTDILFLLLFAAAFVTGRLKSRVVSTLVLAFLFCLFASSSWGMVFHDIQIEGFAFHYKYLSVFLLLWFVLSATLTRRQVHLLLKLLAFSFIFLVAWAFYYQYLRISGAGIPARPDFPLSEAEGFASGGGGHLYGTYLSTGFVTLLAYYLFCVQRRRGLWHLMLLVSGAAIILTGSRAPIIAIGMGVFVLTVIYLRRTRIHAMVRFSALFAVLVVAVAIVRSFALGIEAGGVSSVVRRTFSFDVEDLLPRMVKVTRGIEELSSSSVILGIGPQASPNWFDNSVIRILIDSGLAGLLCFGLALSLSLANANRMANSERKRVYFNILLVATSVFVVNNLSTEFFLVTRVGFPFVILFGLLYSLIRYPDGLSNIGRAGVGRSQSERDGTAQ